MKYLKRIKRNLAIIGLYSCKGIAYFLFALMIALGMGAFMGLLSASMFFVMKLILGL